ncbi:adenosine receptor A3-like [Montipora capricornis]|uniref:adenosine receptor A3-like n=1 Tax=Montipora capricornis TaxID=246305 RepID=UPI0035F213BC
MFNSTDHNTSDSQGNVGYRYYFFEPSFMYPVCAVYILIAIIAALGNLAVVFTILANRSLRSNTTYLYLLSLAISDLITATMAMPFDIEYIFQQSVWKHEASLCVAFYTAWYITVPTSIFTLLAIGVDRFLSLRDPMRQYRRSQFSTKRSCLIVIITIWIYSIIWALLPVMGWHVKGREPVQWDMCMVPFTKVYFAVSTLLNFVAPLLISCVFFILAFVIAYKHQRNKQILGTFGSQRHDSKQTRFFAKHLKATKTTLMFLAAFFFCWQPYSYFSIASNLYGGRHWNPYPYKVYVLLLMFGYLNCALNPFLFAFRNEHFRSTSMKFIRSLKLGANPKRSSIRRPSTISTQSSSSVIPENDSKEIRLQSVRKKSED